MYSHHRVQGSRGWRRKEERGVTTCILKLLQYTAVTIATVIKTSATVTNTATTNAAAVTTRGVVGGDGHCWEVPTLPVSVVVFFSSFSS